MATVTNTRFVHDHDNMSVLPCSARPTHHLHTNNQLALQAFFACGTVHHKCGGVRLAKATDSNPLVSGVRTRSTERVDRYLRSWEGPLSDQTREDLRRNDLRGLDTLLYLAFWDSHPGE